MAMAVEKLQGSAILLTNVGENAQRRSKNINVHRVVAISREISRARKLVLESVAALLKKNGLVIAPGQISNIQYE